MSDIEEKVAQFNKLHKEIQSRKASYPENKTGYYPKNYGSLLNAYREGDLSFNECLELLSKVHINDEAGQ